MREIDREEGGVGGERDGDRQTDRQTETQKHRDRQRDRWGGGGGGDPFIKSIHSSDKETKPILYLHHKQIDGSRFDR